MKHSLSTLLILVAAMGTGECLGQADDHGSIVHVTDPGLLERMHRPPDATNVYALESALEKLGQPEPGQPIELLSTKAYGTQDYSYTTVSGFNFLGRDEGFIPNRFNERFTCKSGSTTRTATVQVPLPTGALIDAAIVFAFDFHASRDLEVDMWRTCHDLGGTTFLFLGQAFTSGSAGYTITNMTFDGGHTVSPRALCYYGAIAFFGSNCDGSPVAISQLAVRWKRQISPAPGTATFADVPTGHPFFSAIEALEDSGITGGCGGGNYCPDNPVSRGQMAAFLARALGLHWPL